MEVTVWWKFHAVGIAMDGFLPTFLRSGEVKRPGRSKVAFRFAKHQKKQVVSRSETPL
jgi:hypothetical protein